MINIIVDADACPTKDIIVSVAQKHRLELLFICDTAHQLNVEYGKTLIVDKGSDSVDLVIVSKVNKNSLVITQDYALALLCLIKGASVLHNNGFMINNENIDQLMHSRYLSQKARNAKVKFSNQKKRSKSDDELFEKQLKLCINKYI